MEGIQPLAKQTPIEDDVLERTLLGIGLDPGGVGRGTSLVQLG